ncbi:MAG: RluA family pseudouridine synthase [Thermodesulfobacteria bacterium]|nr:RluA family pseudouridine synthase [Thermodesulfobacteriota bacterium]
MSRDTTTPQHHRFHTESGLSGTRLDKFLALKVPDVSRTRLKELILAGNVSVNGQVCTQPKTKIKANQEICLTIPPPRPSKILPTKMDLHVLYEDEDLIAINKPPGLVVHPGAGNPENTLVHGLLHHCGNLSGIGGEIRPGIVHRIDKDTSGIILVAKNDRAHQGLASLFKNRQVKKSYIALIHGRFEDSQGLINLPIGRHRIKRTKMAIDESRGKEAITRFKVKKDLFASQVLEVGLVTGRTHQIRVHMAHLGHPLLGDKTYGGPSFIDLPGKERLEIPRQMLHAAKIQINHPLKRDLTLNLVADIPEDMKHVMDTLAKAAQDQTG